MSSGDKILNRISLDCDERISQIGAETDEKCAQIMAQAKLDADKISAEIADRAQSKVKQMQAASKSRCDLETRNAFLKRRREEIDKTYSEILNKMKNLPDEDYFELIYTFAKKLNGMSGVVLLNEKDMQSFQKRRVTLKADLFLNAVTLKKTWTSRQSCPKSVTLSRIL